MIDCISLRWNFEIFLYTEDVTEGISNFRNFERSYGNLLPLPFFSIKKSRFQSKQTEKSKRRTKAETLVKLSPKEIFVMKDRVRF